MSEDFYIVPTDAIWEPGVEYGADGRTLPHVSVLLATTGRPDMAERCVQGIRDTTYGHRVEIIAAVDGPQEDADRLTALWCEVDHSETLRGCSAAWNAALRRSRGKHVVLAADDLTWGEGWLDAALAKMAEFPDGWGFVGFNDGHWGEDLSTHYLVSRRLIVEHLGGRIAWEHYVHSFNDVEINERARRAGRYAWCEAAHVTHEHWLFGDRAQDDTDLRNLPAHPASERVFHDRRAAGFPDDLEPVIT
jgi:GT2 family glycosyltransferase